MIINKTRRDYVGLLVIHREVVVGLVHCEISLNCWRLEIRNKSYYKAIL